MGKLRDYLSLVKFAHTIFAMPFALIGFFLGWHMMRTQGTPLSSGSFWLLLLLVAGCMITARNAAMAFNRYIDRHIDAQNERTSQREIPAGTIPASQALRFVMVNVVAFVSFTWLINPLCFYLSPIALLVVLGYSYTKRFTAWCHLVLGLGLSLAPVGAFLAVTGQISLEPVVLGLGVLSWVGGFDIIYALQDKAFDQKHRLNSMPAMLGERRALAVSVGLHVVTAGMIVLFGVLIHGGLWYWLGAAAFLAMLIYQHILIKPHDLSHINRAFFTANGLASVIFSFFVILSVFFD